MFDPKDFIRALTNLSTLTFEQAALSLFEYQWKSNEIYHQYCNQLGRNPKNTTVITDIPFLPIEFFKSHIIKSGEWVEEKVYKSSATTSSVRSQHHVRDDRDYLSLAKQTFENFIGPMDNHLFLALLPSYQSQGDSSLISMVDHFMRASHRGIHYYSSAEFDLLKQKLIDHQDEKVYLFGVSFALLDFIEAHQLSLPNLTVIETGGMKGRRKEIIRSELHETIRKGLQPDRICSEYGMTELTVQAYSEGSRFYLPDWSNVFIRDTNDPFNYNQTGKTGGINIIDLGNVHSCAFIETKDLGRKFTDGGFEVLGRYDNSDIRGCNLMVESL